jgi:hypothetical protein
VNFITFREFTDEAWGLYLLGAKSLLVFLTRLAHLIARIVFGFAGRGMHAATWMLRGIENWTPVKPAIFELNPRP